MKKSLFVRFAQGIAGITGNAWTFCTALMIVIVWGITGPLFQYSDTWQLVINTGTTIITFLMVFLIQNTQNRDTYAIQLKLDELIHANKEAHNSLMDIEELDECQLKELRDYYEKLACIARKDPDENIKGNEDFPLNDIVENGAKRKKKVSRKKA